MLTDRKDPGWAHIVATGGTFTWESWTPSDAEGDSLSHGWGSAALLGIQEALLGVDLVPSTGGRTGQLLTISAPTAGPTRVRGRVHTVAGYSRVRWHRGAGNLTLELTLPPNAAAEIHLPARNLAAVTEHGRPVARVEGVQVTRVAGGEVTLDVGAGTYALRSVS